MYSENDNRFILPTPHFSTQYGKNANDFCNGYRFINYFSRDLVSFCEFDKRIPKCRLCCESSPDIINSSNCNGEHVNPFFRHQAEQNHYNAEQEEKRRNQPNLVIVYDPEASRDTYSPARTFSIQNGAMVQRTFLRIGIENTGGGPAEHCDAKLRVPNEMVIPGTSAPSFEPKILVWDTEQRYEDIGANNFALLNIVFSHDPAIRDGRDNRILKNAFIATPHNISITNILNPRIEDGFGVGRFRFEVVVRAKSGHSVSAIFRLDVNANWDAITMELVT
jgi:hypothetical protein